MKYFIDTHDKTRGSLPTQELTEEQFFERFAALTDMRSPKPAEMQKRKAG
jgi:hypothetical protein